MKITELKFGDMFRYGKQKNYRQFLQSHLLEGANFPAEHVGKFVVVYDNCKQLIIDPDTEVETQEIMRSVKGYGKSYSTGIQKYPVEINGVKTNISHFVKDGERLLYVYCIQNNIGYYDSFDVREIAGFPEIPFETMMKEGITLLQNHISENPESYAQFI